MNFLLRQRVLDASQFEAHEANNQIWHNCFQQVNESFESQLEICVERRSMGAEQGGRMRSHLQ